MSFFYIDKIPNAKITMNFNIESFSFLSASQENNNIPYIPHHNHESLELLYVTSGEIFVTVEDRIYHLYAGDILIITPLKIHSIEWIENGIYNEYLCLTLGLQSWLSFPKSSLSQELKLLQNCSFSFDEYIPRNTQKVEKIAEIILELKELFNNKTPVYECMSASLMYKLFSILFKNFYIKSNSEHQYEFGNDFTKTVSLFLLEHYTENISTAHIAKALFMSPERFCREFKKYFSMTFLNYLYKYRITKAIDIYKKQKISLSELASTVGFSDYNYFSKVFKKQIGESPARYFKKWNSSK